MEGLNHQVMNWLINVDDNRKKKICRVYNKLITYYEIDPGTPCSSVFVFASCFNSALRSLPALKTFWDISGHYLMSHFIS